MARNFTEILASILGVHCEVVSYDEMWKKRPPAEANGLSLLEFASQVSLP